MLSTILAISTLLATPPQSSVEMHNGVPTLFINDRPHTGLFYMTYKPDAGQFAKVRDEAGLQYISFSATPSSATPWGQKIQPNVENVPN